MIVRPFRTNEAWWAVGGALALVALGALPLAVARAAFLRGLDVYAFLIGMMALAEFARVEGVFDWIAAAAVAAARGSRARLLLLVYGAGIVTTAFLSNDATIVVLTPAVIAATARTDAPVLPYVFACALVANAASLTLPIANPSNLLFFADGIPPLGAWFASFALASFAAVVLTYGALAVVFWTQTRGRFERRDVDAHRPRSLAPLVLAASAAVLVATSARAGPLGAVTLALGAAATLLAATRDPRAPGAIARGIAWPVVALTAALFVLVEALDRAGAAHLPQAAFVWAAHQGGATARLGLAFAAAAASNAVNNLPVGLDLGRYVGAAQPPSPLSAAALVGVNVGPNFTVNGSLATLLWLAILRRERVSVSALDFLRVGAAATPLALAAAALLSR